ncbi:MAG: DUF262 domain-containing protein [Candidatus Thiodiazotropha endolucinida]|nr:DUF262 domain-containing protein [Candidatus Thiodiazotropha taylori]MCG8097368.1 DUF262 domain-containing protein [Candidatus Thiodiazotropha endolucinida]MCW4267814.1 DUF262 domain-containing protein [Candidatus Thiodiazotropha endolucinida]
MSDEKQIYESEADDTQPDPDEIPIKDRRVYTQPYNLVVDSLIDQIKGGTIFLQPLSERPGFQRRYVWSNTLASRLIESILLNVPIPPCYLSQNSDFELDVIDGQQRLFSIYRFLDNQFALSGLEVLTDINGCRFHKLSPKLQRQLKTHTLRLVAVTNESHPEIKFDVFQRLNTNTVPLNAQELRNCVYRGTLNELLKDAVSYEPWLRILRKKSPDKRMRDEALVLRFFAFHIGGVASYRTPQKHWLNDAAQDGRSYSADKITELQNTWQRSIDVSLMWFDPDECFRRVPIEKSRAINRALFDLTMHSAAQIQPDDAQNLRNIVREKYIALLEDEEFNDLISRAVDHTKRTKRRFEMWEDYVGKALA